MAGMERHRSRTIEVSRSAFATRWQTRYTLGMMLFLASSVSYSMRFNLSLAIVAMVNRSSVVVKQPSHPLNISASCDISPTNDIKSDRENWAGTEPTLLSNLTENIGEFNTGKEITWSSEKFSWNEVEQGVILGSFFWGYLVTQIPGGILSKRFGGKWPLGLGLLLSAIFTLLTPALARRHIGLLIFSRIVQGLGAGLHFPAQTQLISLWVPPNERSLFSSVAFGGTYFGTAVTLVASGYLIHGNVWGGWPSVFYMSGTVTIIWFICWTIFVHNSPSDHPGISGAERDFIESALGSKSSQEKIPTPWKDIFTSVPVWSNFVAHLAQAWGLFTLLTEIPTYMRTVLNFNIKKNSWLSAAPYIGSWLFGIAFANIADFLLRRRLMSTVNVRKLAQIVGQLGSALALIACGYSGCDSTLAVSLLIVTVSLNAASNSGFITNYVELAPNHAGVILGTCNTIASLTGIGAPFVAGLFINEDPSIANWRLVFLLSGGFYIFATIFYVLFASGKEQPWNKFQRIPNLSAKAGVEVL